MQSSLLDRFADLIVRHTRALRLLLLGVTLTALFAVCANVKESARSTESKESARSTESTESQESARSTEGAESKESARSAGGAELPVPGDIEAVNLNGVPGVWMRNELFLLFDSMLESCIEANRPPPRLEH